MNLKPSRGASCRMILIGLVCLTSQRAHAWWMWTPGDHVDDSTQNGVVAGYHPDQPIPFSHAKHVGERKIQCQYCHSAARRSTSAGIPSVDTCIGCHKVIAADKDSIKLVKQHYDENRPIEWVKVHDLPDYVRFSHKVHVAAKDEKGQPLLECQVCHGPVETMTTAEQWAPLQMGWCIGCHITEKIPATSEHPAVPNAPVSCTTCHY